MASTLVTAPLEYNLTRRPVWVTLESDLFTGSPGAYVPSEPNLECILEVWRDTDSGEEMVARMSAPYSSIDKTVTFEISHLLRRDTPVLPSVASLGVSGGAPYWDEAVGLTDVFRLRHADQYGDPVEAEEMAEEGDYLAIQGGLPEDAIQDINWAGAAIGLHSYYYRRHSSYIFLKPVSRTQPDYVYFVALSTGDFRVVITVRYDDGTSSFYNSTLIDAVANKAYWVQSGYHQVKVDTYATAGKVVVGYNVSIIRESDDANAFTAFYVLDDTCPSWERYILYHNGLGGYETVRMKGITRYAHRVTRDRFERTRWTGFTVSSGTDVQLRVYGGALYNTHTGHYPAYYLEHLRQLLHADMWLLDMSLIALDTYRLLQIISETDEIDLRSDIPAADGFAITYRPAWKDDGYNVF